MGTIFLPLWPWLWSLTYFLKTLTLLITFEQWVLEVWYFTWIFPVIRPFRGCHYFWHCNNIRAFILHMSISCDKIFLLASRYLSLWPWPSLELAIIRGICISQTHLVQPTFKMIWINKMISLPKFYILNFEKNVYHRYNFLEVYKLNIKSRSYKTDLFFLSFCWEGYVKCYMWYDYDVFLLFFYGYFFDITHQIKVM